MEKVARIGLPPPAAPAVLPGPSRCFPAFSTFLSTSLRQSIDIRTGDLYY
jgi:hypothetical protein